MKSADKDEKQFVWHPYTQMKDLVRLDNKKIMVKVKDFIL